MFLSPLLLLATMAPSADPNPAESVRATVGHRGSMADRPGNTMSSFKRGIESKVDFVELDVRTTKDGNLVLMHDAEVDHATDGKGAVNSLTLAEIRKLDAGAKFNENYKGERIPTFREALELCKGQCGILIDLKEHGEEYTKKIASEVREFGDPKRIMLGVRRLDHIEQFRKLLPDATMIGLVPTVNDIEPFNKAGVKVIRLWARWLTDETLVPKVRKLGAELYFNAEKGTSEDLLTLLKHRPEYLSCDNPTQMMETLAKFKRQK